MFFKIFILIVGREQDDDTLVDEIEKCHVVCVVYSVEDAHTLNRVRYHCCCLPSETYGRKVGDSNFRFFTVLPVPPQAAGVIGALNYCI